MRSQHGDCSTARPTRSFRNWVARHCQANERASITSVLQDLNAYGLARKDPDLITLQQRAKIQCGFSPWYLTINVFILPQRVSTGLFRAPIMWFGLAEMQGGPEDLVDRIYVLKAWATDPSLSLVAAEAS